MRLGMANVRPGKRDDPPGALRRKAVMDCFAGLRWAGAGVDCVRGAAAWSVGLQGSFRLSI